MGGGSLLLYVDLVFPSTFSRYFCYILEKIKGTDHHIPLITSDDSFSAHAQLCLSEENILPHYTHTHTIQKMISRFKIISLGDVQYSHIDLSPLLLVKILLE